MNTNQINRYLNKYICFRGTYPSDMLPHRLSNQRPAAIVLNTDPSTKPGTHWVAIFFNTNGTAEYFDPFGFPPLTSNIIEFINSNALNGWSCNNITFQTPVLSQTCGIYCILFIRDRCSNIPFKSFISKFSRNVFLNDILAEIYLSK